jgi:hypothetical protein
MTGFFMSSIGTKHIKKLMKRLIYSESTTLLCTARIERWTEVHFYKINQAYGFKKINPQFPLLAGLFRGI